MSDQTPARLGQPDSLPALPAPPTAQPLAPGMPNAPVDDEELNVRELTRLLRRNAWVIALSTLIVGGLATHFALQEQPRFLAQSTLRIMDERRMLAGGMELGYADPAMGRQADAILSEIEVLHSRTIVGQVVDRAALQWVPGEPALERDVVHVAHVAPDARGDTLRFEFSTSNYTLEAAGATYMAEYGVPVNVAGAIFTILRRPAQDAAIITLIGRNTAIDRLQDRLRTRIRERTDLVDVEYTSVDPALAALIVNTTAEVFREHSQRSAREQSTRRREFVEARLAETERILRSAQQQLIDFQVREQVFSSQEKFATQQSTLHQLDVRRAELQAERQMYESLLATLRANVSAPTNGLRTIVATPGLSDNPVITQLYQQLVRLEATRDSMRVGGSASSNPDFVQVNRLIQSSQDNLVAAAYSHVQSVQALIVALDELHRRHQSEIAAMPVTQAEEARLLLEFETVSKSAEQLREEAQRARIAEAVEVGQVEVIDLAALPTVPVNQSRERTIILGVVLGLMLGVGIGVVREQLNSSVRSPRDVEVRLRVANLAVIPKIQSARKLHLGRRRHRGTALVANGNGARHHSLITVSNTHSASAEAFRSLRTNLIFSQTAGRIETIVVTSANASEGKTLTASNLAVSYAQQGVRVLLIDCDLRRPTVHKIFDVEKSPGLTELVLGHATETEAVRETETAGVFILTSGVQPPNPAELVGGPRFRGALTQLAQSYDLVIYDTPPVLAAAEAAVLAARADGVVMVVRAGSTDTDSAAHALQQLRSVGAKVLGVVLNDAEATVPKYSTYGYYYYSYYGPEEARKG